MTALRKYIYVDDEHPEPVGLNSSPICQICGAPIMHRFQVEAEDGSLIWVGSECAQGEAKAFKKYAKLCRDLEPHIGEIISVRMGHTWMRARCRGGAFTIGGECRVRASMTVNRQPKIYIFDRRDVRLPKIKKDD